MSERYTGSCLCAAVTFSFAGPPRFVADCVCESCRRAHGASAVAWVGVETPRFSIDAGEDHLQWYASSARSERGYCTSCGTRILFRSSQWPGETHMALACFAEPHDLASTGVAFRNEFPTWTALVLPEED